MTTHRINCTLCEWVAEEALGPVVRGLFSWHVYEEHLEAWRSRFGSRPPGDPDPRTPVGLATLTPERREDGGVTWKTERTTPSHLWPCGCLINDAGAHRAGCPDHPEGER